MYELIITEKPDASKRVAESLSDGKPIKKDIKGIPYYLVTRGKKDIVFFNVSKYFLVNSAPLPISYVGTHSISKTGYAKPLDFFFSARPNK